MFKVYLKQKNKAKTFIKLLRKGSWSIFADHTLSKIKTNLRHCLYIIFLKSTFPCVFLFFYFCSPKILFLDIILLYTTGVFSTGKYNNIADHVQRFGNFFFFFTRELIRVTLAKNGTALRWTWLVFILRGDCSGALFAWRRRVISSYKREYAIISTDEVKRI